MNPAGRNGSAKSNVRVSAYTRSQHEVFKIGNCEYHVYPTHPTLYQVGQGLRNIAQSIT